MCKKITLDFPSKNKLIVRVQIKQIIMINIFSFRILDFKENITVFNNIGLIYSNK